MICKFAFVPVCTSIQAPTARLAPSAKPTRELLEKILGVKFLHGDAERVGIAVR
jgi:hypothetical protein